MTFGNLDAVFVGLFLAATFYKLSFLVDVKQRPVLNNMSLPPGVKFASRVEVCPQELTLTPRVFPPGG
jgi:hypothetical protein